MSDDLKKVYTGSRVEAMFLSEILKENGIGSILKKTFESSAKAGWVDGLTQNDALLFVEVFNVDRAKELLQEYFEERDK